MLIDDFDFNLPEALIAQHPIEPRDAARLLLVGPQKRTKGFLIYPTCFLPVMF